MILVALVLAVSMNLAVWQLTRRVARLEDIVGVYHWKRS